ncbi:MAG: TonB family protein [Bacteroidales bacterium]|nr:TonB family protein [Bacteroidales bacterium]
MKTLAFFTFFTVFVLNTYCQTNDTIFYGINWEKTEKSKALYYRLYSTDSITGYTKVKDCLLTGIMQMEGQYTSKKMKKEVGEFKWYDENGNLKLTCNYNDGKKHGIYTDWFENGKINYTGSYLEGERTGEWNYYFENEQKSATIRYEKGEKTSEQYWNEDGSQLTEIREANKLPEYPGNNDNFGLYVKKNITFPQNMVYIGVEGIEYSPLVTDKSELKAFKRDNILPQYPGINNSFKFLIQINAEYPKHLLNLGIEGLVFVSFIVDKEGNMNNVEIVKTVHPKFNKEVLRLISLANEKWTPGKRHNRLEAYRLTLPINFYLAYSKPVSKPLNQGNVH